MTVNIWAQETSDMHMLELWGPVQSVKYIYVSDVTPDGKPTKASVRSEGTSYFFNKQGRITSALSTDSKWQLTRDEKGNIRRVVIPKSPNSKEDDGTAYTIHWTHDGYPKKFVYDRSNWIDCTTSFIYGPQGILWGLIDYCAQEESESWETMTTYCVLEVDELYSNWTKRLEITIYKDMDGVGKAFYTLTERTIKYF